MFPILRFWDKISFGVREAVLAAFLAVPALSQQVISTDSLPADSVLPIGITSTPELLPPDSLPKNVAEEQLKNFEAQMDSVAAKKTVLYLGGGERSPWFSLGVLYAVEEYGVPVDSIVGTSWGAWLGSLWSRGVPVDEIQRIMLDPFVIEYMGKILTDEKPTSKEGTEIAVSPKGVSSLRQRFNLYVDSAGHVNRNLRSLESDSLYIQRVLARLRLQESLYRQDTKFHKPFAVQGCGGELLGNSIAAVIKSLPLWKFPKDDLAYSNKPATKATANSTIDVSGEFCPHYALPAEDHPREVALIVVAEPLRSEVKGDERYRLLVQQASALLASQPGVVIRAHSLQDSSRKAWIQAGFSSVERKLTEIKTVTGRSEDYSKMGKKASLPWFKFNPSFDGVSSELHTSIKSRWNDADTGFVAPEKFLYSLAGEIAYDSLSLSMMPNGDLLVGAAVHPTFDLAVGGFGSNAIGPNAYFEATVNYVDQMEIALALKGFWGGSSYGFRPRLNVDRLWNKHWSVQLGYDYMKLSPMKSFNNDIAYQYRILTENRNDFMMSLIYQIDEFQNVKADFLFGHRTFEMDPLYYGSDGVRTYPVSPMLWYSYQKGDKSKWFARDGLTLNVGAGLESIGFDFGVNDVIPIYWKFSGDIQYSHSPKSFVSLAVGAAGGIERYHEDGFGYVNPPSFGYAPLDVAYRFHGEVSPWMNEWYNPELASHEFALIRGSAGLHNNYLGVWLFASYFHDFEDSPYAELSQNKFILEPALLFSYKSIKIYAGLNRIVDKDSFGDLKRFKDYTYFIRVGEYSF